MYNKASEQKAYKASNHAAFHAIYHKILLTFTDDDIYV